MNEMDLFERLRILESLTHNKRYFYYDSASGTVVSIHNSPRDESYPCVEMSLEELPENFSSFNLTDFLVVFENNKHTVTTKKITVPKIDGSIPVVYLASTEQIVDVYDLLIGQDNAKKEFRLSLSDAAKDYYAREGTTVNFTFFVTLEDDPSILFTSFTVPFRHLLEQQYVSVPFGTYNGARSKLYTIKFFQKYLHVVCHENTNA